MPRDLIINIASCNNITDNSTCKLVSKAWFNIFSSDEVRCISIGLLPTDLDILAAIKNDKKESCKQKIHVFNLCKSSINERQFLKAQRCSSFLQEHQLLSFQIRLKSGYNKLNNDFAFSHCDQEQQNYFDNDKLKEISRFDKIIKRLDFSIDINVDFEI